MPELTRKASWCGENAKSVAGALWEWIEMSNSFKREFQMDKRPSFDVVAMISLCGDHFIDEIGPI